MRSNQPLLSYETEKQDFKVNCEGLGRGRGIITYWFPKLEERKAPSNWNWRVTEKSNCNKCLISLNPTVCTRHISRHQGPNRPDVYTDPAHSRTHKRKEKVPWQAVGQLSHDKWQSLHLFQAGLYNLQKRSCYHKISQPSPTSICPRDCWPYPDIHVLLFSFK